MKQFLIRLTQLNRLPVWIAVAAVAGLIYLGVAQAGGYSGFPLDDAWIHQTYARNLGLRGEFSFTPGIVSTGSTAPLWTVLLSLGYRLGAPFKAWAYVLGILFLGLSGFSMARLGQRLAPQTPWLGPVAGLALVTEWHLVWAAVSGMETALFVWLSIFLLEQYSHETRQTLGGYFRLGVLGGLLALVRPEGLGLAGLMGLHRLLFGKREPFAQRFQAVAALGLGLLLPVLPYLAFNYAVSGMLMPNTFYAKQQEYGLWLSQQYPGLSGQLRYRAMVYLTPMIGAQILLLPGLVRAFRLIIAQKQTLWGLVAVWALAHLSLYALRLPVTYQHGRYQLPDIPWLLLLGLWGTASLVQPRHPVLWIRVLSKAGLASIGLGWLAFVGVGAQGYANDVQFIETEMVATAHWLNRNSPPDAIIAAHDIGAIGYFTERPLVDLAGLITPAVIPFIRNEDRLLAFSQEQGAAYLVTFPSWYPRLTTRLPQIYSTNSPWAVKAGYDNMAVYQLNTSGVPR